MFKGAVCRTLGLAALVLAPSLAHAGLVQQTQSFSLSNVATVGTSDSTASNSSSRSSELLFAGFDTSLGLLTAVDISFASSYNVSATGSATDYSSESYTYSYGYDYSCGPFGWFTCHGTRYDTDYSNDTYVSGSAQSSFYIDLLQPAAAGSTTTHLLNPSCGDSDWNEYGGVSSSCSSARAGSGGLSGDLDLSSFDLSDFTNELLLSVRSLQQLNISCDNNDYGDYCSLSSTFNWAGAITVAYSYDLITPDPDPTPDPVTTVPAPAPLLLLALGLLGLGFSRRR